MMRINKSHAHDSPKCCISYIVRVSVLKQRYLRRLMLMMWAHTMPPVGASACRTRTQTRTSTSTRCAALLCVRALGSHQWRYCCGAIRMKAIQNTKLCVLGTQNVCMHMLLLCMLHRCNGRLGRTRSPRKRCPGPGHLINNAQCAR